MTKETAGTNLANMTLQEAILHDAKKVIPILEEVSENVQNATEEELRSYAISAHGMKGALANIGETEASKLALTLEKAGKAQDRDAIKSETPIFLGALRSIVAKIGEESEQRSAEKDEDPAYLAERLEKIRSACASYDIRTAKAAIEDLEKMSWTKKTITVLDRISGHLLNSDFEEAAAVTSLYQKLLRYS